MSMMPPADGHSALSTWLRYLSLFNEEVLFPENCLPGGLCCCHGAADRQRHGAGYVHRRGGVLACLPPGPVDAEAHVDA